MNDDLRRASFCVSLLAAPSSPRLPSRLPRRLALAVLLGAVGAAPAGRAEPREAPRAEGAAQEAEATRTDLGGGVEVAAGLGYSRWSTRKGMNATAALGTQGSLRWRALRVAVMADVNGILFGPTISRYGGGIGLIWMSSSAIQFDALVEGGASLYERVGKEFFVTEVSGASSAVVPFVGVRVGLAWRFARILILGVLLELREDVTRVTLRPTVTSCIISCDTHQEEWTVGGTTLGVGLRFGVEL